MPAPVLTRRIGGGTEARLSSDEQNSGPMVPRIQLGSRLRNLRQSKGVSREEAGYAIRASESKISRMELGRVGFKERDVTDLLRLYGVDEEEEHRRLLALARQANRPGWWHAYSDVLSSSYQSYLDLEQSAELIRTYELQFVPGLLQTDAYARAVITLGYGSEKAEDVDRRADLRMARKRLLSRPEPPRLWAVIDEAVLRRPIGGLQVLRDQIEALLHAVTLPNVRLQVVRFSSGGHAAAGGAFTILRFPHEDLSDVVYVEHLTGSLYLDKSEDVDQYAAALGRLFIQAEQPNDTEEILRRALERLDSGTLD